jgi:hypothetical protein
MIERQTQSSPVLCANWTCSGTRFTRGLFALACQLNAVAAVEMPEKAPTASTVWILSWGFVNFQRVLAQLEGVTTDTQQASDVDAIGGFSAPNWRATMKLARSLILRIRRQRTFASDLETAKVGDAGFHQVEVHFHEIVLDPPGFCGGEDSFPVEAVLAHGDDFLCSRGPALDVHRKEAAGIFHEILGGVVAFADGGDLELKFD